MTVNIGLMTSNTDEWATPQDFFDQLDEEYHFTLDPCCTEENKKCRRYFTKKDNGLLQDWGGQIVFCNPPYGKEIGKWVKKASEERALTVMLLPARTDTKWFHDYIYNKADIVFLKGRLKFGDAKKNAPFPSMVVVFDNIAETVRCKDCRYWYGWETGVGSCHISDNPYNWRGTDFTDYCSFGEKREQKGD